MKFKCEMNCTPSGACVNCGWNPVKDKRRHDYIEKHGLTVKKDHSRGIVLKDVRKKGK